ncbi:MAG: FHA domain-containing protein [Chloroflexi bacterium]|nr:MAG: FHA domain-containing protein [Chloroflexota bacterium]
MPASIVPEDLYRFRWIDHVRLSRDGERVAYQVMWPDATLRQNQSRIVVRRLLDPEPAEATAGPRRDHSPEWSPDGQRLAFVSRVGAADQIFVLDLTAGGPAKQLSWVAEGAGHPSWSPDGSWIAFAGTVLSDPDAIVDDPRSPDTRDVLRRAPVARVAKRLDYKHDGQGYVDGRNHHLFVVPSTGGEARQLTTGPWEAADFDWSPDSTRLVVAGNADPDADLRRELNLYVVDLQGNRRLLGGGYVLNSPIWSPRGDLIGFIAPNGLDAGLLERLWVVPLAGGSPRCLTADLDLAVNDSVINDMRAGHDNRTRWSDDGERIYFVASAPAVTGVHSVDLDGNVRQEVGGRRRIYDFDIASGVLAFLAGDASNPGDLYVLTQGAEAKVTELNPWLNDRYIAQPEQHYFTAPDGWKLEGWVLKPQNFDPGRLHPLVMEIHGGPHGQYGLSFFHEFQVLAGMGYVVFYMNPRGSDGYGERFRREVVRDWGGKDYLDLMSALDQLIERTGYIDVSRMGVGGGSYGGYMTNWIIGQTQRFSAAVAMRSISNLVSEYAQHDIVLWGALELGPPPWPDLDELWRRSPIRYVKNVKTPLLLTAGEMDLRCAMSQSEEMFGALRLLGKTVELVRFPEESHDLSRGGRPDRRVERLRRIGGWYERFLGTAAVDHVAEEATQILPVPAEAPREWAKTVVIEPESHPEMEPVAVADAPISEQVAEPAEAAQVDSMPEPEVVRPDVPDTMTAEQAIVEPDALPVLPGPELDEREAPEAAALEEPEPVLAEPAEPEVNASEPVEDAVAQATPAAIEAESIGEVPEAPLELEAHQEEDLLSSTLSPEAGMGDVQPEPAVAEPVIEPAAAEEADAPEAAVAEAEIEPAIAEAEPAEQAERFDEPVTAEPEPVREPLPWEAESPVVPTNPPAPHAEPEPEPPPEPEPEPAPVAASGQLPFAGDARSTIVAWPGNGTPAQAQAFDEATSVIPAWQSTGQTSQSKRTVSLQAMPLEQIESGAGFAALLTFESGPFAGRIVALPNQMVSIGRAPDNDVVVGDPATSGHHGRIEVRGGSFWISDLGSTNGTLVNGEPVIDRELSDGDQIAIGQNTIRFTLEG